MSARTLFTRVSEGLRSARQGSGLFTALMTVIVIFVGGVTGLAVVRAPTAAWALIGAVSAVVLVLVPAHVRIAAAVLAAVCSRLFVATGLVSSLVNFFHYPIALAAALVSAVESSRRSPLRRPLEVGMLSLLGISLASWLINGGELVRPFLDWLVFCEPFFIIYAVVTMPPRRVPVGRLWMLAVILPFAQVPLATIQAVRMNIGDYMQGFFIGMGAGAHVAGAVFLAGTLICIARALDTKSMGQRVTWLLAGTVLFAVAVLTDAKQVVICFLPALVLVLAASMRLRMSRVMAVLPALAVVVLGAFSYYRPLQAALDWTFISRGAVGKVQAFAVVASNLSQAWYRWIIGLGPGNSISRVAQMGLEAFVKPDSPVYLLGLSPAPVTRELWTNTTSNYLFASSSVWSGISSWLGLLGDLGLAGLASFLWIYWRTSKALRGHRGWQTNGAGAVLLMTFLLGFLYSWLEEPGFTLPAALVVGLGLVSAERAGEIDEDTPRA